MEEYKSIHTGEEIDEAVTRAFNLSETTGLNSDKIMSQKAITEELNSKMEKIEGKGLSSNDFSDEEKLKLAGIEDGANKTIVAEELGNSTTEAISQSAVTKALDGKLGIDSVVDIAHGGIGATVSCEARNNLKVYSRSEIDEKIRLIPIVTQSTGESTDKVMSQAAITNALDDKVDKIEGKGLSTNDFTTEAQEKLNKLNTFFKFSLSPDRWDLFNNDIYTQTISFESIKSTDSVIADISLSDNEQISKKEQEYWDKITKIEINDGNIKTYYRGEIPDISLNVKIKI